MAVEQFVVAGLALLLSVALTGVVRVYALRAGLLDAPNLRSSHLEPTPRGGGIAIAAVVCLGLAGLAAFNRFDARTVVAIVPAGLAVAIAGFVDDRRGLSPGIRFAIHLGAAILYLVTVSGPPTLGIRWLDSLPWLAFVVTLLGLVWLLNLFNFMDGIDGIAGSELASVSFGLALVACLSGGAREPQLLGLLLGSAGIGFLAWNWPPARIFMGDVGSGFAGMVLGMLALQTMRDCDVTAWVPLILLGVFTADATLTLLRRALRGERLYDAHRTHAYQWMSRRWGSHRRVVLGQIAINMLWLLPLALLAQRFPRLSWLIAIIAYMPLVGIGCWAGAGRAERSNGQVA
ncbi:MAG: glycosyltransferase family 4 protein [Pseudomonadota bacterium]